MDLHRKPDRRWLYAVVGTAFVIGLVIWIYIRRKRRKHQLLSQQLEDLATMNNTVQQRHEQIIQEHTEYTNSLAAQIEQNCYIFMHSEDFPDNMCWKDYDALCKIINDNFGMIEAKLRNKYHLSEKEIRLCILVLLGISGSRQMAGMLFYAESGIRNFKNRIAKKMGTNSVELRHFLINIAISEYSKCM